MLHDSRKVILIHFVRTSKAVKDIATLDGKQVGTLKHLD